MQEGELQVNCKCLLTPLATTVNSRFLILSRHISDVGEVQTSIFQTGEWSKQSNVQKIMSLCDNLSEVVVVENSILVRDPRSLLPWLKCRLLPAFGTLELKRVEMRSTLGIFFSTKREANIILAGNCCFFTQKGAVGKIDPLSVRVWLNQGESLRRFGKESYGVGECLPYVPEQMTRTKIN